MFVPLIRIWIALIMVLEDTVYHFDFFQVKTENVYEVIESKNLFPRK